MPTSQLFRERAVMCFYLGADGTHEHRDLQLVEGLLLPLRPLGASGLRDLDHCIRHVAWLGRYTAAEAASSGGASSSTSTLSTVAAAGVSVGLGLGLVVRDVALGVLLDHEVVRLVDGDPPSPEILLIVGHIPFPSLIKCGLLLGDIFP